MLFFTFARNIHPVRVYHDPEELALSRPVVTLGLFDGVHRGHQLLLQTMKDLAHEEGRQTLVITLWPHPRIVLGKIGDSFSLLNTLEEKIFLLERMGIDHVWVLPFDQAMASLDADDFVARYLTRYFIPGRMVIGDDHHFGKNGEGNVDTLRKAGLRLGFSVDHLHTQIDNNKRISSSFIRACLSAGDLGSANKLLGYPYLLMGEVESGKKLGRSLGFPTANIRCCPDWKHIPADGVYAVRVDRLNQCYDGMLNIGIRPTINDHNHRTIEAHLFEVDDNLYGETLRVHFIAKLRDEMRFNDLDALRNQLVVDRVEAAKALEWWKKESNSYLCTRNNP